MSGKRRREPSPRPTEQAVSHSKRAKLQFPASRVEGLLREGCGARRLISGLPVFLAGVLHDLTGYIVELAGKEAQKRRKVRITLDHMQSVVDSHHLGHPLQDDTGPQLPGGPLPARRADASVPAPGDTSSTASSSPPNLR